MKNKKIYEKIEIHTEKESFSLISNKKNNYDLYVGEFDSDEKGHNKIINKLSQLSKKSIINIHISSCGGDLNLLVRYINMLKTTIAKVNGYLNYGYSCGALIFGACQNKYIYEHSTLMYHNASWTHNGKANEIKSCVNAMYDVVENLMKKYYLGLSKEEFEMLLNGKDFWLNYKEIKERGIIENGKTE